MTALSNVRIRASAWLPAAWDRAVLAHRRYTSANGDALAGSMTYALLVGAAPAVLLARAGLATVGVHTATVTSGLHTSAHALLPREVGAAVDHLPQVGIAWRITIVVGLIWIYLRLVRATRTGVRAMCAQNAGSGNPIRDAVIDAGLGAMLLVALGVLVGVTAVFGNHWWGMAVGVVGVWLLIAAIMLRGSWSRPGRPTLAAAIRAALVAALVVELLRLLAGHYFVATATLHNEVYRAAGGLIGILVWCSLACRTLLRATAWASTAPTRHTMGEANDST